MIPFFATYLQNFFLICQFILLAKSATHSYVYYCQNGGTKVIQNITEGVIKTRETEEGFSGNNLRCSWVIKADPGSRIHISIDLVDLQWSPKYTTCNNYDNLQIYEGKDSDTRTLVTSVCHARSPYNVVTKGSAVFLQMTTTEQDFSAHRGIELTFQTFGNTTCPPGWFQASDSQNFCLMIGTRGQLSWLSSHDVCAYSLSNLASVLSEAEYKAVVDHGRNQSVGLAWIGLSDLNRQQRSFKWVDTSPYEYTRTITDYGFRTHCIAQDFTSGHWKAMNCDKSMLNYVCKAKKDGSTKLYQAVQPSAPPEEEEGGSKVYIVVIVVLVVVCVIAVMTVVLCCYLQRRRRQSGSKTQELQTQETTNFELSGRTEPCTPAVEIHETRSQMVAPPTYEEAQGHPRIY